MPGTVLGTGVREFMEGDETKNNEIITLNRKHN